MITDVEVREAGAKGLGVFATRAFAAGEFVFRRRNGTVVRTGDIGTFSEEDQRHITELDFEHCAVVLPRAVT